MSVQNGQHAIWVVRNINQWSWTSDENMCRSSDCVSTAWDLVIFQRIAKAELAVCPIVDDHTTSFCTVNSQRRRLQQLQKYDSSSSNDHTRGNPCSAYKTGKWKPQHERAGNVGYRILNLIRGQVICTFTAAASPKSVFVNSRNPRITRCQDGNGADNCFSAREVSTNDNSAVLCLRETDVGWPDCRSARVERSLPTSEELAKPELQSKRSSGNPWTRLLRHPSPIRIQEVRGQNCSMGSEIENRMGLKWYPTSKASINSCYNSKLSIRGQVSKSVE